MLKSYIVAYFNDLRALVIDQVNMFELEKIGLQYMVLYVREGQITIKEINR